MAINYTRFRAVAERLIEENGRSMSLRRMDQGNPADPLRPWRASDGDDNIALTVIGVFIDFDLEDIDGTLVKQGDKRVLVAATSVEDAAEVGMDFDEVEDFDSLFDGSENWKIVKVNVIEPGTLRILYDIQVRK
jgi:hypothetical protein